MKNIWNIFRADWRRLTASVVAVVVLLGLCLVPCLYAWFNILSNWDPYGNTGGISIALASRIRRARIGSRRRRHTQMQTSVPAM